MIKNIFLPQKIGLNFLESSVFAFQYQEDFVATSGINKKNKLLIKQVVHKSWPNDPTEQSSLLQTYLDQKIDTKICLIPDHLIMYRKTTLPLADKATIKKIIAYEVGPTLPFKIEDSYFDFFIQPHTNKKTCTVWIAFILKKALDGYLEPLENKSVNTVAALPGVIDLVLQLNKTGAYLVVYQNGQTITLCLMQDKELQDVYTCSPENLNLTIESLNLDTKDFYWFGTKHLETSINFKTIKIQDLDNIELGSNKIASLELIAAAYQGNFAYGFNFLESGTNALQSYQLFTIGSLLLLFIFIMLGHLIIQQNSFRLVNNKSLQEIKHNLTKVGLNSKKKTVPLIVKDIQKTINDQENIWFAFSQQKRFSFLFYLAQLTKQIDPAALGLTFKKVTLNPNQITITGEVKDYPALQLLEEEINESPYFETTMPLQETSFNVNIKVSTTGNNE